MMALGQRADSSRGEGGSQVRARREVTSWHWGPRVACAPHPRVMVSVHPEWLLPQP